MTADTGPHLAHIISQTKQNIEFLIAQKQISQDDGRDIIAKLSKPSSTAESALVKQTQNLQINSPSNTPSHASANSTPSYPGNASTTPYQQPPVTVPASSGGLFPVKAAWDYNETGQNHDDLSFRAGDVFEVIAETNVDWWTGRHKGKEGLFPCNYVERLPPSQNTQNATYSDKTASPSFPATPDYSGAGYTPPGGYNSPSPSAYNGPPGGYNGPSPGGYNGPPHGGYNGPPPSGYGGPGPSQAYSPYNSPPPSGYQSYPPPTGPPPQVEEHKKGKKEKSGSGLGHTLAQAAVGGVGFGAGSAVGAGIIDSLF